MFLLEVAQNLTNDEMVKQMQEQVISMQDKQISFLNNTITTILAAAAIIVTLVSLFLAGIATYIGNTSKKAKKTMEEAESVLGSVRTARSELVQDMSDLATYREETRQEFEELTKLVNSEEIAKMKEDTKVLATKQRAIAVLNTTQKLLDLSGEALEMLKREKDQKQPRRLAVMYYTNRKDYLLLSDEVWDKVYDSDAAENLLLQCLGLKVKSEETLLLIRRTIGGEMKRETKIRTDEEETSG